MKVRVRHARYQDVFHIEQVVQAAIEESDASFMLPEIQRPHIYNFLNYHIPRGEIFLAVADDKLAGFAGVEASGFAWHPENFFYTGFMILRKQYSLVGAQKAMLTEMIAFSRLSNAALVFRTLPGIKNAVTAKDLADLGAVVDGGSATFIPPERMEKQSE